MFTRIREARSSVAFAVALAIGAMFGGSLVSVAAPQAPIIYTRVASCGGLNFYTASDGQPYGENVTMRKANGQVRCNASLPNGAVVTKVVFTVMDNTSTGSLAGCALVRVDLIPNTILTEPFPYDNLTDFMTTGGPATPGLTRLTDTTISTPIVNNVKWAYYVQCDIDEMSNDLGVYGASVTYQISSTKG